MQHPQQQQKTGWPIGRRKILSPSDRRMLHDISDNLSHLRVAQQRPSSSPTSVGPVMRNGVVQNSLPSSSMIIKGRSETGTLEMESVTASHNGIGPATVERAPSGGRNDRHRKAMEQIRQSLQDFRVQAQQGPTLTAPLYGLGSLPSKESSARQDQTRQVADRNVDKVWEVAAYLATQDEQNGLPSSYARTVTSNKVLKPANIEKCRTSSPLTGFDTVVNGRSDSPSIYGWDASLYFPVQNGPLDAANSIQTGLASSGNSFGPTTSDQASSAVGGQNLSSRVLPTPTRLLTSSAAPVGARSLKFTGSVNTRPVSGPPVQMSTRNGHFSFIGLNNNEVPTTNCVPQVATVPSLQSVQQPVFATVPNDRLSTTGSGGSSGSPSPAPHYSPIISSNRPAPAMAWSARQPAIVMQQVTSCEVEWPMAQKATVPPRANREATPDVGSLMFDLHGSSSFSEASVVLPATVVSTLVTFNAPSDSWTSSRAFINQSPLSHTSSGSSTPSTTNSADVPPPLPPPDKPPPPYPGRAPATHPPALRPVPPLPGMAATSFRSVNSSAPPVDMGTSGCQLIESPKPVRRAEACKKDAERSETKVRHYSPHAFRFFMEQHVENVLKMYMQRLTRRNQLEGEMSHCGLPEQLQGQIRRMLAQKESNYLRLRRARIDRSMFDQVTTLGTGAFGQVDLVVKRDSGVLFALKTLRKRDVLRRNQVAHVKAERDILAEADNEWVVKLYYSFQDATNLYFVMDYIPGGDLMGLLIRLGVFEHELAQFYIAELVLAIESVHVMGFIHRDIKPDNILIDKNGHIRLTDFGLCTGFRWTHDSKYYQNGNHQRQDSMEPEGGWSELNITGDHGVTVQGMSSFTTQDLMRPLVRRRLRHERKFAHSLVGTPNYIAPEVLARTGYTSCCDWWSVGVILYEMRVGQPPFLAQTPAETQRKVINWQHMLHIPPEANLSDETIDLIQRLCCAADTRLGRAPGGASDLKRHPFFAGIEFETLRQKRAPFIPQLSCPTDTSNFDPVDVDDQLPRRSASLDSLLGPTGGGAGTGNNNTAMSSFEGGRHAFLEFTFRRFFDDNGQAHVTPYDTGDRDDGSPIYV